MQLIGESALALAMIAAAVLIFFGTKLAIGGLMALVKFTCRHFYAVDHMHKLIHEAFNIPVHILLMRQNDVWIVDTDGPTWDRLQAK